MLASYVAGSSSDAFVAWIPNSRLERMVCYVLDSFGWVLHQNSVQICDSNDHLKKRTKLNF
jgi:hypothetical protein